MGFFIFFYQEDYREEDERAARALWEGARQAEDKFPAKTLKLSAKNKMMNYFAGGSTPRRAPPTSPQSRQTPICHPRINHPRKNVSNIERMQKKIGRRKKAGATD